MKVIFFGAGNYARDVWKQVLENPELYADEYVAVADNNPKLRGTYFCGKQVIAPSNINKYKADLVVITSVYESAIRKQLVEELGISEDRIYIFEDYTRKCYPDWIYRTRYGNKGRNKANPLFNTSHMIVYTAITGNYDELKEPLFLSDDITYVCITNNREIKSNVWNMEYIENDSLDNVHLARHIKMNPHIYFHEYETSVWVDGKYQIMDDLREYISLYQKESDVLCFPHPERRCICNEAAACIAANSGNKKDIILQVADYLRDGYPLNYGLYETGCIVRRHNDEKVKMLMRLWEGEVLKYSIRDQLSFPYICWKNNFTPDICALDVNRNPWLLQRRTNYKFL